MGHLMVPESFMTFQEFPICETEPELCAQGKNARQLFDEFLSKPRPRAKPLQQFANTTTPPMVRVLLNVPDWWYASPVNLAEWDRFRDPTHCSGVICDARFGQFKSVTNSSVDVSFKRWPPPEPESKPHVFLRRLGPPRDLDYNATWEHHDIAFAPESCESCGGRACQYVNTSLYASPATILAAMTEGHVISIVVYNRALFKKDAFDKDPQKLSDFPEESVPYYSGLFVSNCDVPVRKRWLEGLMKEITLASCGDCSKRTSGMNCPRGQCSKVVESGKYPFAISLENHPMLPGYATEKVVEAFRSNSLPGIWASPDIDAFSVAFFH